MNKGKIVSIISNLYGVLVDGVLVKARARGKFRQNNITPTVGDEVEIDVEKKYIIHILSLIHI